MNLHICHSDLFGLVHSPGAYGLANRRRGIVQAYVEAMQYRLLSTQCVQHYQPLVDAVLSGWHSEGNAPQDLSLALMHTVSVGSHHRA